MFVRKLINKTLFDSIKSNCKSEIIMKPAIQPLIANKFCRAAATYEGDGKTSVQILNKEMENGLMINSFSQVGFRLNNDMMILGPMAIFPKTVLSWNIAKYEDINDKTLSLFCVLEPKIDVLVVGIGDAPITPVFSRTIIGFMQKYGINVEVLGTEQACATFNFLNAEGRMVGGAFLPPNHMSINENDLAMTNLRRKNIYEIDD